MVKPTGSLEDPEYYGDELNVGKLTPLDAETKAKARTGTISVSLLGLFFFFLFFSYNTTQNFETTLNANLGFWSLSILYFCFSFSNLISSRIVRILGVKISLVVGGAAYSSYIAANIYPEPYILLPFSAVIGVGAAILWNAQGVLLAKSSVPSTVDLNSGIFFAIFMFNLIFGNLFAAVFLSVGLDTRLLFIVLTIVSTFATICFLLIKSPPKRELIAGETAKDPSIFEVILIFKNRTLQLLVCSSVYFGLSQSLFFGSFTELIGDTITIGYVMSVFGCAEVIGSFTWGWVGKKLGKRVVVLVGSASAVVGFILSTVAFYNDIGQNNIWLFYITGIFFGFADSAYNTQLYAIFSSYFVVDAEPYFAGLKLLQASSTSAAFFYSPYVPYPFLVLITAFFMFVGLVFLFVLDRWVDPIDKKSTTNTIN